MLKLEVLELEVILEMLELAVLCEWEKVVKL